MDYLDNLGRKVKANFATNGVFGEGTIFAYVPRPSYIIRQKDGNMFTWVCDLCEIQDDEQIELDASGEAQ